ncbi:hypothetical protein E3N88_32209 [Mikania micrantha]|uniref:Uncharacterized protein n=1 Tax=Mikania micrantha TaxID=192012 RepID=A0A5N6M7V7_9ASTR|nr:hypothetical protein E3N88_32209 [Mikania micrantha]
MEVLLVLSLMWDEELERERNVNLCGMRNKEGKRKMIKWAYRSPAKMSLSRNVVAAPGPTAASRLVRMLVVPKLWSTASSLPADAAGFPTPVEAAMRGLRRLEDGCILQRIEDG